MRIAIYLVLACLIPISNLFSQERMGLQIEKYSGVNALRINPGNGALSPFSWDVNLVGAGLFVENRFAFAQPTNLFHMIMNSGNLMVNDPAGENPNPGPNDILVDYFSDSKERMLSMDISLLGPSFMVQFGENHSIGILTEANVVMGGFNLDKNLGIYDLVDVADDTRIEIEAFDLSGMAWSEFGFHYSYSKENYLGKFSIGANLKLLKGYEGFYLNVAKPISAHKVSSDSVSVDPIDLGFGMTNRTMESSSFTPNPIGNGFGMDLGMTWIFDVEEDDYRAKVGLSLVDIGKISFDKWTEKYRVRSTDMMNDLDTDAFSGIDNVEEAVEELGNQFMGDTTSFKQIGGFEMWTPAGLSIQGDFQIIKGLYVGAILTNRLSLGEISVPRNNTLAVYPRFENRWFGIGFPMVVNNWQDFRLGTSARVGFLTIGSDNLGSLIGKSTLTGTDLYFALKVNPFEIGLFGKKSKKKGKSVRCYDFK
ncbi:MAG: hypothetical protein HKN16_12080 [Saprospiraceae bacterium]|nr:hypothetical protein [Saprospiraceae bacterium]